MLNSDADWLFVNPRGTGPIGADAATKALGRARNQIGLADFRVHDLRRTAATRMGGVGYCTEYNLIDPESCKCQQRDCHEQSLCSIQL